MDLSKLADPFPADDIEWRVQSSGVKGGGEVWARVLAYITARAIMERLDRVCGPENWKVRYTYEGGGVMCHLAIDVRQEFAGERWVEKSDGAEQTDIEKFKGGLSSALKRAGSVWSIGRYLYKLEAGFAETSKDARKYPNWAKTKDGTQFSWDPPELPPWALPGGEDYPRASEPKAKAKKKTKAKKRDVDVLTDAQLKQIGILRRELGLSEDEYRGGLKAGFGVESAKDLSKEVASNVIERMKRRVEFRLSQEGKEAFGGDAFVDSEPGRLEQLRELALGYCEKIRTMGWTYQDGGPIDYKKEGLAVDTFDELIEIINAMGEEKELEAVNQRLDNLVVKLSF